MKRPAGEHREEMGWMERGKENERRGEEERKKKGVGRRRIRQLFTAISGGQQQSKLRSLSASGGAIQFTFHLSHTHSLFLQSPGSSSSVTLFPLSKSSNSPRGLSSN